MPFRARPIRRERRASSAPACNGEAHSLGRAQDLALNKLKARIDEVIKQLFKEHGQLQKDYDKKTHHGEKQSKIDGDNVIEPHKNLPLL